MMTAWNAVLTPTAVATPTIAEGCSNGLSVRQVLPQFQLFPFQRGGLQLLRRWELV